MFPRILYADREKTMLIDWLGLGKLQVIEANGGRRIASTWQKQFLFSSMDMLRRLGMEISPRHPITRFVLSVFAHALWEHSPSHITWKAAAYEGAESWTSGVIKQWVEMSKKNEIPPGM